MPSIFGPTADDNAADLAALEKERAKARTLGQPFPGTMTAMDDTFLDIPLDPSPSENR